MLYRDKLSIGPCSAEMAGIIGCLHKLYLVSTGGDDQVGYENE